MNSENHTYCKNCGTQNSDAYCRNCGQRTSVNKVTFKETFDDFVNSVLSIDAPFFITLKGLFVNPGCLFREFLEGKRKKYYKPVAFFILTTVVYLVIRSIIDFDPFQDSSVIAVDDETATGSMTKARNFMLLNINKLLFVFVFSLAFFLKLFFYKKYSSAEFVAISFYLSGVYTIITTLNMFYIKYVDSKFQALAILLMGAYFLYAMVSFFRFGKVWVLIKSGMVYFLAFSLYIMLAFGLSYLMVSVNN